MTDERPGDRPLETEREGGPEAGSEAESAAPAEPSDAPAAEPSDAPAAEPSDTPAAGLSEAGPSDVLPTQPYRPPGPARPPRPERRRLTHVDRGGRPRMVDVSAKAPTARRAVAEAFVTLSPETLSLVIDGGNEKGDVLAVAELAGVMGGKRTSELIPLCHPLPLTDLVVAVSPDRAGGGLRIRAEAATTAPTGVEMEALTAASVAALTVYDMVKGVERGVEISAVRLVSKTGGKSGDWYRGLGDDGPIRRPGRPDAARGRAAGGGGRPGSGGRPGGARSAGRIGGGRRRG